VLLFLFLPSYFRGIAAGAGFSEKLDFNLPGFVRRIIPFRNTAYSILIPQTGFQEAVLMLERVPSGAEPLPPGGFSERPSKPEIYLGVYVWMLFNVVPMDHDINSSGLELSSPRTQGSSRV
jgi:hypothetical protein